MAKRARKEDPQERARRKLARAQLRLEMARDKHAQEGVRAEQEIERARLRAARWVARSATRVERRTQAVAQAEADLASASGGSGDRAAVEFHVPEATADHLAHVAAQAGDSNGTGLTAEPQSVDSPETLQR